MRVNTRLTINSNSLVTCLDEKPRPLHVRDLWYNRAPFIQCWETFCGKADLRLPVTRAYPARLFKSIPWGGLLGGAKQSDMQLLLRALE